MHLRGYIRTALHGCDTLQTKSAYADARKARNGRKKLRVAARRGAIAGGAIKGVRERERDAEMKYRESNYNRRRWVGEGEEEGERGASRRGIERERARPQKMTVKR